MTQTKTEMQKEIVELRKQIEELKALSPAEMLFHQSFQFSELQPVQMSINQASGEANPRYNANTKFSIGRLVDMSAKNLVKARDYLNGLEYVQANMETFDPFYYTSDHDIDALPNAVGRAVSGFQNRVSEFHFMVDYFNTIIEDICWGDGKIHEDYGSDWFWNTLCPQMFERKVLDDTPKESSADAKAARLARKKVA